MRSYLNRHYIILIHGVAGKEEDFGAMVPALMTNLNLKGDDKYIVKPWCYHTADDDTSTEDFARDFVNMVANLQLKKEDKLSFITHSQGAIIFHLWLASCLQKKDRNILRHLDFFIAIAPPYWGTKIAEFGISIKKLAKSAGINLPLPHGKKQLQELSYGSNSIFRLRQLLHESFYSKIRIFTLAGKAQIMNFLAPFTAGNREFEDDSAVPITSTRCGFYHTTCKKYFEHLGLNDQHKIEHGSYVLVDALHLSPSPNKIYGLAQITNDCISSSEPGHPSYKLIEDFILNKPFSAEINNMSKCSSFLIDINIELPANLMDDDITLNFFNIDGSELNPDQVILSRFLEPYSSGETEAETGKRFYYSGSITKDSFQDNLKQHFLLIKINTKSGIEKKIEIAVRATYSSFIDILLSPNQP